MSNLIPQQRPDKNGKVVTRHVKADTSPALEGRSMPAPKIVDNDFKVERIGFIRAAVESAFNDHVSDEMSYFGEEDDDSYDAEVARVWERLPAIDHIEMKLEALPTSTVGHVAQAIADSGFSNDYHMMLSDVLEGLKDGKDARAVEYFTYLHSHLDDIFDMDDLYGSESSTYEVVRSAVVGLGTYKHLGYEQPEDIFNASEEDRSIVIALCKMRYVSLEMSKRPILHTDGKLDDEGLVPLVIKHHEYIDRIIEIMRERGTNSAELIQGIIESEVPAVSSGQL